jgi:hypothetical protein
LNKMDGLVQDLNSALEESTRSEMWVSLVRFFIVAKNRTVSTRDRCYDFKNNFTEKMDENCVFVEITESKVYSNLIIILVFEKNSFFRRK